MVCGHLWGCHFLCELEITWISLGLLGSPPSFFLHEDWGLQGQEEKFSAVSAFDLERDGELAD